MVASTWELQEKKSNSSSVVDTPDEAVDSA